MGHPHRATVGGGGLHRLWVRSLAVVGPVVFSGSDDGALRRWDAETGLPLGEPISAAPVRGMTARGAADGLVIATGSPDALIAVWRPTA
ncbi:PQQ-binding-like beta-propeller repeat protein [Actinosynnema mirum]|uniref:Uncharacterized protein n=1 Tax=Actinosynnema mirum (strain ATCC 29888 / DSM 43827 / JCM 3225 / NBRC 14064 / NCIMB 13271 / NRRL B-12336 / IMRU 3971 / 101) TaxID=446462 RepID=C6WEI0_ACTMD|nr:PQQ-binding-like beta-propeller repeat protein [Actinosynnema mirum]ACU37780.1 conserved hypothetical protein [Actinosynnema mirum DSM 43827]